MDNFMFLYLALMIVLTLGVLLLLRSAQRGVLTMLAQALARGEVKRYLSMLNSRRLSLVLRKSTWALLRLEGDIRAGDAGAVAADKKRLDGIKLRPGERLEYHQKVMSFHLSRGEYEEGRAYLKQLEQQLGQESNPTLKEILSDAQLLIRIYADRDFSLVPTLEGLEAVQQGGQRGVTRYRLAKLCHFAGQEKRATAWLEKAASDVADTPWQPIVAAAQKDHRVLEER